MYINQEYYDEKVGRLIAKAEVMKTDQVVSYIAADLEDGDFEVAYEILRRCSRHGVVWLSRGGYAMSQGAYMTMSPENDKFWDGLDLSSDVQIMSDVEIDRARRDTIDCLWEVVQSLPDSQDFMIAGLPWYVMYIIDGGDDESDTLVQVARFRNGSENAMAELIKAAEKSRMNASGWNEEREKEFRTYTERIAIIDNPDHAWLVPHCGFTRICRLDDKDIEEPFKIVKVRKGEEVWND